jgi:hypothetical protein
MPAEPPDPRNPFSRKPPDVIKVSVRFRHHALDGSAATPMNAGSLFSFLKPDTTLIVVDRENYSRDIIRDLDRAQVAGRN